MKTKRLLIALAAVLLNCGVANAQVKGDVNKDNKLNVKDVPALADSLIDKNKPSMRLDINENQKVNIADVVALVTQIQNIKYFWFGTGKPTSTNFDPTVNDVTTCSSLDEALRGKNTVTTSSYGVFVCPAAWNVNISNYRFQDVAGNIYELQHLLCPDAPR